MTGIYVFDAYGTLFDVHAAIRRHATGPDAERMSDIWRTKQLEYTWTQTLAGEYIDFRTLTERALDFAMARVPAIDAALKPKFLAAYSELEAFPDASATLRALKARGDRTAILSNGTPGMLKSAVAAAGMTDHLDAVLSVDAVKLFKPRREVYALVTTHFGAAPRDVTFVSSNRWDVMGAAAFGFRCVWINRAGFPNEYPEHPPVRVLNNLENLLRGIAQSGSN